MRNNRICTNQSKYGESNWKWKWIRSHSNRITNNSDVLQTGNDNASAVGQNGTSNKSDVDSVGDRNDSSVLQNGDTNISEVRQSTDLQINPSSNDNTSTVTGALAVPTNVELLFLESGSLTGAFTVTLNCKIAVLFDG